ncbi:DUF6959 family protein [Streptomyces albiflavescens]
MERVEAELFTDGGNDAVVRLPGRNFPGVLIQGDTLSAAMVRLPPRATLWGGALGAKTTLVRNSEAAPVPRL